MCPIPTSAGALCIASLVVNRLSDYALTPGGGGKLGAP